MRRTVVNLKLLNEFMFLSGVVRVTLNTFLPTNEKFNVQRNNEMQIETHEQIMPPTMTLNLIFTHRSTNDVIRRLFVNL